MTWRRRATAALGITLLAGFLLGGLQQVRLETRVESFLPSGDPAVHGLHELGASFGGDPIVVLLESERPRGLLGERHLLPLVALEGRLSTVDDVAAVYGPGTVLNQVAGQARTLLVELSAVRDALRDRGDRAGLRRFDARYGPLVVQGLPAGLPSLRSQSFVTSAVYTPAGDPRPQWRFVVPNEHSAAILVRPRQGLDQAATQRLVRTVESTVGDSGVGADRVTISGVPVIADALGEQVQAEVPLLGGLAIAGIGACFLLVPWAPLRRRLVPLGITLVAVCLTVAGFGWLDRPLSLGILAFLSVLLGIGSYYPTYFAQRARPRTVLVVTAATAVSLGTLALSPLPFVQDLGIALALGVTLSALLGLLVSRRWKPAPPEPGAVSSGSRRRPGAALRIGAAAAAVGVAVAGWAALPGLPMDSNPQRFAAGLPALQDARHVEQQLGSSGELAVMLTGKDVTAPQAVDWMRAAQQAVISRHGDQLRPIISPATLLSFLGADPSAEQVRAGLKVLPRYLTAATIRGDERMALLSFGLRMNDLGALRELRDRMAATLPTPPRGYRVELGGLPMVAARGDELLSADRVRGNVLGIFAAGAVLLLGLRRRSDALRAIAAAVLATGASLLALSAWGIALSPLTVALGSLTAAVACEFTVLMSAAVRQRSPALRRSVWLATAASTVGYAVLASSQLAATREFGLLLATSVLLSCLAAALVSWLMPPTAAPTRRAAPRRSAAGPQKSLAGAHG